MSFEWIVALRYLREGRMQTLLILGGVAVGVGVIIFLAALMDGLAAKLIQQTLGYQAHIVVRMPEELPRQVARVSAASQTVQIQKPAQRVRSINQWPQVMQAIEQVAGVVATSPTVAGSAFAARGEAIKSVALRGVDPARFNQIVDIAGSLHAGRFQLTGNQTVIGLELAQDLGAACGDKIRLIAGDGRNDVFTIAGIFDLQNKDVNQRWVLVSLRAAQTLLDLTGGVSTIEAKVAEVFQAERLARQVGERTGLQSESWMTLNAQLLVGLRSQDSSRYMIQFFVIVAVALGIASVLVVWVVQKNREIGILRAIGVTRRKIALIFLLQGGLLGLVGSLLGAGLGTLLALGFASMAKNPDGSPTFPVELTLRLYLTGMVIAVGIGLLASLAPARRAARLDPARVIHHG